MNYQAVAASAAEKIRKSGKAATIVRPGSSSGWTKKFNSLTNSWYWENAAGTIVTANPAVSVNIPCYVLETKLQIGHIDNTLVQSDSRFFMCTETPELGDQLHVDGAVLTVVPPVVPFRPAEVTLYTEVHAR